MYLVSNFYLSRIVGSRLYDAHNNAVIGHIRDLVVNLDYERPKVVALQLRNGRVLDYSHIDIVKDGGQYSFFCNAMQDFTVKNENTLFLVKSIQDKQIVDMDGRKVVRVNDLRLAVVSGGTYLIAVDVGLEGLLRRLGVAKPLKTLLKKLNLNIPSRLILWDDVQAVNVGHSGIQLAKEAAKISTLHPSDIADIIEDLDRNTQATVFASLDEEKAADVLEEMEPEAQMHIIDGLSISKAADVLEKMPADEVADILDVLEKDVAEQLLTEMDRENAHEVRELMKYPNDTVGSVMSTDFTSFGRETQVGQVLEQLRREKPEMDTLYYLYIVNNAGKLIATVSLRDLVVSEFDVKLEEIMDTDFISVHDGDDIDSLADVISKYSLPAVPVINDRGLLLGIVVVNDVVYNFVRSRRSRI